MNTIFTHLSIELTNGVNQEGTANWYYTVKFKPLPRFGIKLRKFWTRNYSRISNYNSRSVRDEVTLNKGDLCSPLPYIETLPYLNLDKVKRFVKFINRRAKLNRRNGQEHLDFRSRLDFGIIFYYRKYLVKFLRIQIFVQPVHNLDSAYFSAIFYFFRSFFFWLMKLLSVWYLFVCFVNQFYRRTIWKYRQWLKKNSKWNSIFTIWDRRLRKISYKGLLQVIDLLALWKTAKLSIK